MGKPLLVHQMFVCVDILNAELTGIASVMTLGGFGFYFLTLLINLIFRSVFLSFLKLEIRNDSLK